MGEAAQPFNADAVPLVHESALQNYNSGCTHESITISYLADLYLDEAMPGERHKKTMVRAWAPKRKTGCITCKARHVKCDEGRPHCNKCASTGRTCDGYSPKTNCNANPGMHFRSLAILPEADASEQRAFDHFLSCTALELTGYFSTEIWDQRVPRSCLSEPALFHIMIAMSSIHEGYTGGIKLSNRNNQISLYSYALKHYAIAIKSLKVLLFSNPESLESILLCCALFVCFDSLRGNYKAASTHLQSGLKLLMHPRTTDSRMSQDTVISRTFTCLALQVGCFMDSHLPDSTCLIWERTCEMNAGIQISNFTTINDARHDLNLLLSDFMLHQTQPWVACPFPVCNESTTTSSIKERLKAWTFTFDAIVLRKDPANLSADALRAAILLKIHHASLTAMVDAFQNAPSDAPYKTIVTLARSLLGANAASAAPRPSISSDLGLVGPLFVTVSRCTIPQLRWEALALLKTAPRRDGLWDAGFAARIALSILKIEEQENPVEGNNMQITHAKIQDLRIKHQEYNPDQIENDFTVDVDYATTDSTTGLITMVTTTLLQ